jgi:predicted transposase YdaD
MKESTTYQAILQEGLKEGEQKGEVKEARKLLLEWGSELLGQPNARTQARLAKIDDLERLEALFKRLRTVASWQTLLADAPIPQQ